LRIATYIIQLHNLSNLKVAASSPFDNHNQAMAIRNDWPELASIINKTLNAMQPEDHEAIRSRWLSIRYEYGFRFVDILKWTLGAALIAVTIIALILIWNRRLQIENKKRKQAEYGIKSSLKEKETLFQDLGEVVRRYLRCGDFKKDSASSCFFSFCNCYSRSAV
jgi:hypothetical protein